ncbi:unnamed protein product [Effrenium voratum]|nr:unnamed protein product [Effrenium voratum]
MFYLAGPDSRYRVVGHNRYAMFGSKDKCMMPSGDFKKRFLEYDPKEDEKPLFR